MRSLAVIPEQPIGHFVVEGEQIGEQQVFVPVDEFLLDGAIESLIVRIHLRRSRIGMPVDDGGVFQRLGKGP